MKTKKTKKPAPSAVPDGIIKTPVVRIGFPYLFSPRPPVSDDGTPKFEAVALFEDGVDMAPFVAAANAAFRERWPDKSIKFKKANRPVKSCDDEEKTHLAGYEAGGSFINLKSGRRPPVVDQRLRPIVDAEGIFPGCFVRFAVRAYAWDHKTGGKGVSFSLEGVQLVREGERLGGGKPFDASTGFDACMSDDEEEEFQDAVSGDDGFDLYDEDDDDEEE